MNLENMGKCEQIYQRHQAEVVVGRKTAQELVDCVKGFVDLKTVPPMELFTEPSMEEYRCMMRLYFDSIPELKGKTPEFEIYLVVENEKSAKYYERWNRNQCGEMFIWVELHSVLFQSNSCALSAEISRLRGLRKSDLEGRTTEFALYMIDSFPCDAVNPLYET